jgi:hypothetical protein
MAASIANGTALRTIAIPLRKPTTSGRTKYMYFHNSAALKKNRVKRGNQARETLKIKKGLSGYPDRPPLN